MPLTPPIFLNATYNFSIFSPYHSHFWERPFPFLGKLLPFPFLGKFLPFPFLGMVFGRRILYNSFLFFSLLYSFLGKAVPIFGKTFPIFGKTPYFLYKNLSHFWETLSQYWESPFPFLGKSRCLSHFWERFRSQK